MAKNENIRIAQKVLSADIEAYQAFQNIAGYKSANEKYESGKITASFGNMQASQTEEVQTAATAAEKKDTAITDEWTFHNNMLGVKIQVAAQFGDDSPQLQALGLKRKSDYKQPAKKKVKP
jgi:hypothetical protein